MSLLKDPRTDLCLSSAEPELDGVNTELFTEGFRALADPHRLRILHLLLRCGEMCVCECIPALGLSQSNLSFHLKALKYAGFIKARKSGKWMYYSLNRPVFDKFLTTFGDVFSLEKWPEKPECRTCDDNMRHTTEKDSRVLGKTA